MQSKRWHKSYLGVVVTDIRPTIFLSTVRLDSILFARMFRQICGLSLNVMISSKAKNDVRVARSLTICWKEGVRTWPGNDGTSSKKDQVHRVSGVQLEREPVHLPVIPIARDR